MLTTTIALGTVLMFQAAPQSDPSSALAATPVESAQALRGTKSAQLDIRPIKSQVAEITKNEVSVRSSASVASSVLVTVSRGATAKVVGTNGDWVHLQFQRGTLGWVHASLLKVYDSKLAEIVPTAKPSVVTKAPSEVVLPETPGRADGDTDRSKRLSIVISGGKASIRRPQHVAVVETLPPSPSTEVQTPLQTEPATPARVAVRSPRQTTHPAVIDNGKPTSSAEKVLRSAAALLGSRYVWGATGSRGAYDCSGFTGFVFRQNGVHLPRTAMEQFGRGTPVDKSSLQPGDLIFFSSRNSRVGHVGIYVGSGTFIHCSSGAGHVTYSPLSASYYTSHYVGARRVLSGKQTVNSPIPLPDSLSEDGEKN